MKARRVKQKSHAPEIIERGVLRFRVHFQRRAKGYSQWTLSYRLNGQRHRVARADRADLDREIDAAEIAIANGQTDLLSFSNTDKALLQRLRELAGGLDTPLEILVAEAVEARRRAARVKIVSQPCPDLAAALLDQKRREKKVGEKWLRSLASMLDRLGEFWSGPLHLLQAHDLNTWLRGLPGGLVYRRHHHGAALQLINYARTVNAVAPDAFGADFWRLVDNPAPDPVEIKVWTPERLVKLLEHTRASMIPFTVLQAFAGIRHEELNPEEFGANKSPLDWSDCDWEQKHVEVRAQTGKTGARIVPLSDNLIAWLKPYAKQSGPVCAVRNTSNALTRAKQRAGLPAGKNESRNILRKSFGSYRLAVVKNIGQVAEEMGNSPAKIKSNYRKPRPEREGHRWFAIIPTSAEILQLKFGSL